MADPDDHRLAVELAEEVGIRLLQHRAVLLERGATPDEIRDEGDRVGNEIILERLAAVRPDDEILSEEARGEKGRGGTNRLAAARVWIIDPLDGTREFGDPPRADWAIHIALVEDGRPTAAAVALPASGSILSTLDPSPLPPEPPARPRIAVSRSRPPAVAEGLAEMLDGELVPMGSAGAKVAAVVTGEVDLYPHAGGQWEWDSAAPVGVAAAAGLWTSRIDMTPLRYNRPDPYLPDLLVAHPALVPALRGALAILAPADER